jgi:hypothetical protein
VPAIRGAIALILWEKLGYLPMDQEMTLYIFNNPSWIWLQEDSLDQLGKPREYTTPSYERKWENRVYFGLKVLNGCHESMINLVCNEFWNRLFDKKDVSSNSRIGMI